MDLRLLPSSLVILAGAMLLAGCSSPDGQAGPQAGPLEVLATSDASHGERFTPAERSIAVGATLTFRVIGTTPHTVDFGDDATSSVAGVSDAHSGNLGAGQEFRVTFTQPGSYDYFCQYHLPGMTGTVTVT